MNKIVLTIFGIFIAIALVVGLYNYSIILEVKEDTTRELYLIESTNAELAKNISLLESTNTELRAQIDVLENQPQSYDFLLFSRPNGTATNIVVKSGLPGNEEFETTNLSEALEYAFNNDGRIVKMKS